MVTLSGHCASAGLTSRFRRAQLGPSPITVIHALVRPWSPREATERIRALAKDENLELVWTRHAEKQMAERGLIMSDVLYLLANGVVYDEAEPASAAGLFRYRIESPTPNSGGRSVRAVVIPSPTSLGSALKIVTVMWVDEK